MLQLLLSLIVFLLGLWLLRRGLTQLTTRYIERFLQRLVKTPWRGFLTGIAATLVTQSSAAVTILSMGMVAAGMLRFEDTVAIILGSNIGSTFTLGIISQSPTQLSPWLIGLGIFGYVFITAPRWRTVFLALCGFGLLLYGFQGMTSISATLLTDHRLSYLIAFAKKSPLHGVLAGTLLTMLITSSSASTALTISLAKAGLITLITAIALVLGHNIGTCLTSILMSIGGSRSVVRVALTHVLLNVVGVLLFLPIIQPFQRWILQLSPHIDQQIILSHILFNGITSIIALPFTRLIATSLMTIYKDKSS